MKRNRLVVHGALLVVTGQLLCLPVIAQDSVPQIKQDQTLYNRLWQSGPPVAPSGGDVPSPHQFSNVVAFAGVAVSANPPRLEVNGTVLATLQRAQAGGGFLAQQFDYLFGEVIPVPAKNPAGANVAPDYWDAEPYATANQKLAEAPYYHTDSMYYWSPHAQKVFAVQPGPISITWRAAVPITAAAHNGLSGAEQAKYVANSSGTSYYLTNKVNYLVGGATFKPSQVMYWTENAYRQSGYPVAAINGQVSQVKLVYNAAFPEHVAQEIVVPDVVANQPATSQNGITNTLWFDSSQKLLRAYNREGRVFLELLGNALPDGSGRRKHLGYEIVTVQREPHPVDVPMDLGERLKPFADGDGDGTLSLPPVPNASGSTEFLFSGIDADNGELQHFTIKETQQVNDLQCHWLRPGDQGLLWPARFVRYAVGWPRDPAKYSHYVRPRVATQAEAALTAVALSPDDAPVLVYQDALDRWRGFLTPDQKYYSFLEPDYPAHRALLRFHARDRVAFLRVFSWLDEAVETPRKSLANSLATNLTSWEEARLFDSKDIADLPGLAARLRTGADPVSIYVKGRLSSSTLTALAGYDPTTGAGAAVLRAGLVTDLNTLIQGAKSIDQDLAATWLEHESVRNWYAVASSADGSKLVAGVDNGGIYTSTDHGLTWKLRESAGLIRRWRSIASSADGTRLAALAILDRIYTSSDSGVSWVARDEARDWHTVVSSKDGLKLIAAEYDGGIYTSEDGGVNWNRRDAAGSRPWRGLASSDDGTVLAAVEGSANGRIHTSQDGGVSWTEQTDAGTHEWFSIASSADGSKLLAAWRTGTLSRSSDGGNTWVAQLTDQNRLWTGLASSSDGTRLVATEAVAGRIYTSSDSGQTWAPGGPAQNWVQVASSADGSHLVTVANPGKIYTRSPMLSADLLRPDTLVLRAANPQSGTALLAYNRLFLEDAFPNELARGGAVVNSETKPQSSPRYLSATARVGERLLPPDGELGASGTGGYVAGYVHLNRADAGSSYSVTAYQDPFLVGFEAANLGAILPVNVRPGDAPLEVWWFRTNTANVAQGFHPAYWPAVIARYTLEWPENPPEIVLASNLGGAGADATVGPATGLRSLMSDLAPYSGTSVGTSPEAVAVADFNGDRRLDFVTANSGGFEVWTNQTPRQFARMFTQPANRGQSVTVGDFNQDGLMDWAGVSSGDGALVILTNSGQGGFQLAQSSISVGDASSKPRALVAADWDGDSHPDLACANRGDNKVVVAFNRADRSGTFFAPTTVPILVGASPSGLAAGDFNADGHMDLAVALYGGGSPNVTVLINDGTGNFDSSATQLAPALNYWDVTVADLNQDGHVDLAAIADFTDTLRVWFNDGNGGFRLGASLPKIDGSQSTTPSIPGGYGIATGDFNGDGRRDLAALNQFTKQITVLTNTGSKTFLPWLTNSVAARPYGLATGDLDGNAVPDLVVAVEGNHTVVPMIGMPAPDAPAPAGGSLAAKGRVYYQNDPKLPGYNPNEEHALMLGGTVYALRDDLNVTAGAGYSSDPYVLLEYTGSDGRPLMDVFKVLREKPEAGLLFDYVVEAGKVLQAPMPLPLLPAPVEGRNYNTESLSASGDLPGGWTNASADVKSAYRHYEGFTLKDRKEQFWVYRGLHAGLPALEAGSYVPGQNGGTFASARPAEAVVGKTFDYTIHASRRPDSLVLNVQPGSTLPGWLSITGPLTLGGNPTAGDVGTKTFSLVLTDTFDKSEVEITLTVVVYGDAGPVATQGPLRITSFNQYSQATTTYIGRPPALAADAAPANSFTMRFYYKTQEGFAWPGLVSPPAVGSIVPYLRPKDAQGKFTGEPGEKETQAQDIVYRPTWPAKPPKMQFGQTLAGPVNGLPDVRGQTSLQVLYQQSIASDIVEKHAAVTLFDPTREKTFELSAGEGGGELDKIPPGVKTDEYLGATYFPNLPPHLVRRFFFDPNRGPKGALVFRGEYKDELTGDKYLLLNVLGTTDLNALKALCPDGDYKSKWDKAVNGLATEMVTYQEDTKVPGTFIPKQNGTVPIGADRLAEITDSDTAVDSYALSAGGPGSGYVTLITGNGRAFTPAGDPVTVYVLRVDGSLYRGEVKMLLPSNPLSELLTFQHTLDLAGKSAEFDYEWRMAPPVDGQPPTSIPGGYPPLTDGADLPRYLLGGAGVQTLVDNWVILRYRPNNKNHPLYEAKNPDGTWPETGWSEWTEPKLAEGWVKRVLAGINPFNQRITDLFNNRVNTDVSLVTQAGTRWEGDIALNLENINNHGLIEIYETVLKRARGLSIDANPGINFGPANDALLLAAGYLSDLYMILGNEAWADAANPTVGFGTKDKTYGDIATALFAFKGQVPSLLGEELALLRGRDDFLVPGVGARPVYNRLFWNYTRGIDAGEVVYALNYNVVENPDQSTDGVIGAADAARLFPQGHGDAYGHYLTALKGYYSLLGNANFTWVPRIEAVNVLDQPVSVDYLDERKFAVAAAATARAGRQVFDLTWRQDYQPGSQGGWDHFGATRVNSNRGIVSGTTTNHSVRHWGLDHWASRTGQGAYLHWVVGNTMLPEVDPDPAHEGIQKIDRTTVPELQELPATAEELQAAMDNAEGRMSPLGLSDGSLAFDINPNKVTGLEPQTHFEQVYARTTLALKNAVAAFDDAKDITRLMRSESDSLVEFQAEVARQELAYTNALIDLYGTPYPDDVGPGKTYKTEFAGPDLIHHMYVDKQERGFGTLLIPAKTVSFKLDLRDFPSDWEWGAAAGLNIPVSESPAREEEGGATEEEEETEDPFLEYELSPHGFFAKPDAWTGRRASPGQLQGAISEVIKARNNLFRVLSDAESLRLKVDGLARLVDARKETHETIERLEDTNALLETLARIAKGAFETFEAWEGVRHAALAATLEAVEAAYPKSLIVGFSNGGDLSAAPLAIKKATTDLPEEIAHHTLIAGAKTALIALETTSAATTEFNEIAIKSRQFDDQFRQQVFELGLALRESQGQLTLINQRIQELDDARRNYAALLARGERLQQERLLFRQRAAAITQGHRTRDAAFRIFRNEKLERYNALFELAARYTYLAAQAFDYETGLLGTEQGRAFKQRIVNARALGVVTDEEPQFAGSDTGDPGLSSVLAEMAGDWAVLKSRLGFNNPDAYGTTVSLRLENFRILPTGTSDPNWRDVLHQAQRADLLEDDDVRRHCQQIDAGDGTPVPGLIVEFSTQIADGYNLFGKPLAAGDHAFSPSSFATKVFAVGVAFPGYRGMDDPAANSSAVGSSGGASPNDPAIWYLDPLALAANPYVYLIPVGVDYMRSPPLGDSSAIRSWAVDDVTIPLPFNIGGSDFSAKPFYLAADSLSEPLFAVRKHQAFRPVASTASFVRDIYAGGTVLSRSQFANNRLIGRSVWNSKWKLVIPGKTLLHDPKAGLDIFIQTVKDIQLHFVTYSYSGN